jgi:hypothetical protein
MVEWITVFCIFSKDGNWNGGLKSAESWGRTISAEWLIIDTTRIPCGYVTCPVKVIDESEHACELFAGHTHGVAKDDVTIAPGVGWALFEIKQ